jgi:DNA-binding SARP family transcriptional activator
LVTWRNAAPPRGDKPPGRFKDGLWVDAVCFENLATEALDALNQGERLPSVGYKALGLYRGHFLSTDLYVDWIVTARRRYQRLWTALVSALARLELEEAHFDRSILLLARLVDEFPDDEAAVKGLMIAYAASGHRAEALRTYRRLSVQLTAALDIEPGADLKALEQAIRAAQPVTEWMPRELVGSSKCLPPNRAGPSRAD